MAAATAASADIDVTLPFDNRITQNLADWLQQHGRRMVESLAVTFNHQQHENGYGTKDTTIDLPFQELKQLRNLEVSRANPLVHASACACSDTSKRPSTRWSMCPEASPPSSFTL
jgi:hypothetical protein